MTRRVTFLYAHRPSGHSAVAAALEAQLKELEPKVESSVLDINNDFHPILGPMVTKAYLEIIQKTPKLWDYLYDNELVSQALGELKNLMGLIHRRKLRARFADEPDIIVCTHALPCATLALEKEKGNLSAPLAAVITDYGVHAYWISQFVDLYLAPTDEVKSELVRRGIDAKKIRVTGIPIHPRIKQAPSPEEARRELGLGEEPAILISGGSKGLGPIQEVVSQLAAAMPDAQLLVACGNNEELLQWVEAAFADKQNVKAFGYTERFHIFFAASQLSIGKPGGVTISESLAAGVPMVFLSPLPGQEERNAAYVTKQGAAARVETHADLTRVVKDILSDGARLSAMKAAARKLGRPESAKSACAELLTLPRRTVRA